MTLTTKFQAKNYRGDDIISQFTFTVTHNSVYNAGEAAEQHLQTIYPGKTAWNAGKNSGNIYQHNGQVCYFAQV